MNGAIYGHGAITDLEQSCPEAQHLLHGLSEDKVGEIDGVPLLLFSLNDLLHGLPLGTKFDNISPLV